MRRRRPQWDWSEVFSVRAEDLVRPSPAFARHWLGFVASIVRPITIVIFATTPAWVWIDYFPDRQFVRLDNGATLEVLEASVYEETLYVQYLSDVALNDLIAVRRRAEEILAVYAGPKADEQSCTEIELLATEWCENGLCAWNYVSFLAERNDDGDWYILY